jgi:monoamine oxidase
MSQPKATDVVIIGAGFSGLQAALDLEAEGYTVKLLEARNRVGGKSWSAPNAAGGDGLQEMGAAWLNDSNQSQVWNYCQKFGLTTIVQNIEGSVASQNVDGDCHLFPFGELPQVSTHLRTCDPLRDLDTQTSSPRSIARASHTSETPPRRHLSIPTRSNPQNVNAWTR